MPKKINLNTDFLDEDNGTSKKEDFSGFEEAFSQFWWKNNNSNKEPSEKNKANKSQNQETLAWTFWKIKNIFFVIIWIIFVIWLFNSPKEKANSNVSSWIPSGSIETNNTKNDEIIVWKYSCTSYYGTEAWKLEPSKLESNRIEMIEKDINSLDEKMTAIQDNINSYSLDEYSQYSIDGYNNMVDEFNALNEQRKEIKRWYDNSIDSYNITVERYNNYLESNCSKRN
jgi:hypothetical protein